MKNIIPIITVAAAISACGTPAEKVAALNPSDLDTTVSPGENFYKYANGGWQKSHPLKAEYSRYGSFDILGEDNEKRVNDLFQAMSRMNPKAGSVDQKIVDLYKMGLDSLRLNAEGAEPLKEHLSGIFAIGTKDELVRKLGELALIEEGGFFDAGVESDLMDSNMQLLYLSQPGLGMGDRDYYLEAENAHIRSGYLDMLTKMFTLAGIDNPETRAANALAVEDVLAEASWTRVQNRDMARIYNPMSSEDISTAFPGFDFTAFSEAAGIPAQEKIIVCQPSYFEAFSKYFAEAEIEPLKDYLASNMIQSAAGCLSDDFYTASFEFHGKLVQGIKEQKPRWKRAMAKPNALLGEAVGQMYVKKYFPESSKKKVLEIVSNLKSSLGDHIDALDWMSDSTKAYAREKLAAFTVKIGYPDKWKDYSSLTIDPALSYYENLLAATAWYVKDNLDKLGKPTDREEWLMTPQTVNAYYNPTTNEICFPAAILQPPFFNADADDAVNYGGIGVVIGHEMTHGFDDQGRMFDKDGNMKGWWTDADSKAFSAKADILAEQFDKIEVLPGVFANGRLSLGENIADQGGVGVAYSALHKAWGDKRPADIDGFTGEQRFFLSYAHIWAGNITDEEIARRTKTDVHSLSVNRVNATLRNFRIFFDAFGINEGDAMWRPEQERVMIW